jgi:hypothetical protein
MIKLVVMICHMIAGYEGASFPVCHEVVVADVQSCTIMSQIVVADWKENSIYRGDQWTIARVMCKAGDYQPKDAI